MLPHPGQAKAATIVHRRAIAAAYDARGTTQIALRRSFHTTSSLLRTIVLLPGWLWAWLLVWRNASKTRIAASKVSVNQ